MGTLKDFHLQNWVYTGFVLISYFMHKVVNFHAQMSSSQSESQTMFFHPIKATEGWEFRPKTPVFYL